MDVKNGWQCTKFEGGRCKLSGQKKGTREWWVWRVCHCPGKRHIPVPPTFCMKIDRDGDPTENFEWCTLCPLAALELIWQHQDGLDSQPPRCYGKWLQPGTKPGRFGASNIANPVQKAIQWMRVQGATEYNYDTNSGRKSLVRWTNELGVLYPESFPIHGDLWEVWCKNYDFRLPKSGYSIRQQPRDPDQACAALRKLARYFGAGRKLKVKLSRRERFNYSILKALGHKKKAEKIRMGLPSSSEDESSGSDSEDQPILRSPPRPRKRQRVSAADSDESKSYNPEDSSSDDYEFG